MSTGHSEESTPRVLERPDHRLSRKRVSTNALKVLYRLHRSGYLAYLVGGGVRDLLLGIEPKDFDVATNARPEEIRRLFRNSRIIGRRFRLAHVFFRDETVEVSTFRASPEPPDLPDDWEETNGEGEESPAPVREEDPSFGTPAEDARRRDFTVNALFYNIADFTIIDYVGGVADLSARVLRTIGDPEQRFGEDPVRMLRALEYSVRLGLAIDPNTEKAIVDSAPRIVEAAPARLTYELLEGLQSGCAAGICAGWQRFGLFTSAFPEIAASGEKLEQVLGEVDRGTADGYRYPNASLLGALFLPPFALLLEDMLQLGPRVDNPKLLAGLRTILEPAAAHMHIANRDVHFIHHGLFTITKLRRPPERGRQVVKLTRQEYFSVAWDLFTFGAGAGLFPRDVWAVWRKALARVRARGEEGASEVVEAEVSRRRRRRRHSGRRKKK